MKLDKFLHYIETGEIPPESPDYLTVSGYDDHIISMVDSDVYMDYIKARSFCTEHGMWAIVDLCWTYRLAEWIGSRKVLEIMAGRGWLAKALSIHGVDIVATDNNTWEERHSKSKDVFSVVPISALEAVQNNNRDILIVSWPPYGEMDVCTACDEWNSEKPIVYIGEGDGGCNAPERFWQHFKELSDAPDIQLVSWSGIHDHIYIGRYL